MRIILPVMFLFLSACGTKSSNPPAMQPESESPPIISAFGFLGGSAWSFSSALAFSGDDGFDVVMPDQAR